MTGAVGTHWVRYFGSETRADCSPFAEEAFLECRQEEGTEVRPIIASRILLVEYVDSSLLKTNMVKKSMDVGWYIHLEERNAAA